MKPTKKQPLFIITGASGIGKTTASEILFQNEKDYIVLESDIIWNNIYNTPENDYAEYRQVQMNLCANIAQIGLPVVLCGCATPNQFKDRDLFTDIHFIAIICDDEILKERMRNGRNITDDNWIKSSIDFNNWLKNNAAEKKMHLIDSSDQTPKECAYEIDKWIMNKIGEWVDKLC